MNDIKLSGRLFLRKHDLQGQGIGTVTPGSELSFLVPKPAVRKSYSTVFDFFQPILGKYRPENMLKKDFFRTTVSSENRLKMLIFLKLPP